MRQWSIADRYHSLWRRAKARNDSFKTLYGGQFTLFFYEQHHSFFRNLSPLFVTVKFEFNISYNNIYTCHECELEALQPKKIYSHYN